MLKGHILLKKTYEAAGLRMCMLEYAGFNQTHKYTMEEEGWAKFHLNFKWLTKIN